MRIFPIGFGTHKGKHINVATYKKLINGVEIKITHNVHTSAGKQLRWVQTISENGSFFRDCGKRTYVDPFGRAGSVALPGTTGVCKADDLKPFYWTDAEFSSGSGPGFYDRPAEPAPASGRTWLQFITSLTEVTGTDVHHLVAIKWGFDRLASGVVKVAAIKLPTDGEMKQHGHALKKMYPGYTFR